MLTVFIAAMGLFGLIALYTRQRVREVGIRKVLGADTGAIVWLLSRSFMVLVGIVLVITLVTVGWHAVRSAMANPAEALRTE